MGKNNMTAEETMRRDAIARQFSALLMTGSLDEVSALFEIGARVLGDGLDTYGHLDIATDPRDFEEEADNEICDALFYLMITRLIVRARRKERDLARDLARELARIRASVDDTAFRCEVLGEFVPIAADVAHLDAEIREDFKRGGANG